MDKPKICIGVPCPRTIFTKTVQSLVSVIKFDNYETQLVLQEGAYVHENRNNIVDFAVKEGFDYVFFVDYDMAFEPMTLLKLLASNKDIIGAAYNYRSLPLETMVKEKVDGVVGTAKLQDKPFRCYGVPTGCMLIKTSVFKKLERPYFFFELNKEGNIEMSEDILFCKKAQESGVEVWCDPTIEIRHQGDYLY